MRETTIPGNSSFKSLTAGVMFLLDALFLLSLLSILSL